MAQFTAGPQGFARSLSRSHLQESTSIVGQYKGNGNDPDYSRRGSDNNSEQGSNSVGIVPSHIGAGPPIFPEGLKSGKISMQNHSQAGGSFYNKSLTKKAVNQGKNKSLDKKKVLPTKKFPELKLMNNGDFRNGNNTLSSDEELSLAVSFNGHLSSL